MADKGENRKPQKSNCATVLSCTICFLLIGISEFCIDSTKSMLPMYFFFFLNWEYDLSTTIRYTFFAFCLLTPIVGAAIADSWLGKFKTIICLSSVYILGQIFLTISGIHDLIDSNQDGIPDIITLHVALSMVALILIALGTGGIQVCLAAFGGDQFLEHEEKKRSTFFSIFYFSFYASSLLSFLIMPSLRAHECGIHSKKLCYPLPFGVCAALLVVALVVFIAGSRMYTKVPTQCNTLVKLCSCIGFAIINRFRLRHLMYLRRDHWMDWAEEKYDKLFIAQVKMVLKVIFLYIPLPLFWLLFYQKGRWTFQPDCMNGDFGLFIIQPDNMQILNRILILVWVVLMDCVIYPLIAKCNLNFTPLKKMSVGMFLTALAFVSAALVQQQINQTLTGLPTDTTGQAKFINMLNKPLHVEAGGNNFPLAPFEAKGYLSFRHGFHLDLGSGSEFPVSIGPGSRKTIIIIQDEETLQIATFRDLSTKPWRGENEIRFLNGYHSGLNITCGSYSFGNVSSNGMSFYATLPQGEAEFLISDHNGEVCKYNLALGFGSSYTLIIPSTFTIGSCKESIIAEMDISPNSIHMAWQIPQYLLISAGEVMFAVTSLEFAYSQAPSNMKSILQACWLLTIAVARIVLFIFPIVIGTDQVQWVENLVFAILIVLVCLTFYIMAYSYTYSNPTKIEAQFSQMAPEDKEKRKSLEMESRSSDSSSDNETDTATKI